MSSPTVEMGRGLRVENWCGEGMASGMVAGNGAHRERVVDGEAARWWRGGGVPTVGSSHGGRRRLKVLLQPRTRERDVMGGFTWRNTEQW
jgi:hypothetical protein